MSNAESEQGNSDAQPKPQGRLPAEARRAVVELMKQGVVIAETRRLVFETLCIHRTLIDDHLSDMYLRMLIDESAGLALLLSDQGASSDEDDESPKLISRRTLTIYDTLLLIVLRKYFLDRESAGDVRIRIDVTQIEALMIPFLPLTASSSSDRKKLNGALDGMKKRRILVAVRGEDERMEISPVIRYVVNAEYLERILSEYRRMAAEAGTSSDSSDASDTSDEDDDDV